MSGIIAVHCGAGYHSKKLHKEYRRVCRRACLRGIQVLRKGGNAMEAVKAAIVTLENDPITNAGYGSNLTTQGIVECDASVMDGKNLSFGGCGAIRRVKNPITLACELCIKQLDSLPLGLIPPSLLVGSGGLQHAREAGLTIVSNKKLVTEKASKQLKKYQTVINSQENVLFDTVGAVCLDNSGNVAAGCSSGGILLKKPGRVGQAALYGSGCWADSFAKDSESSIAVSTTGCGEHLVQTQLAREIASDLKNSLSPTLDLHKTMTDKFLKSRFLRNHEQKMGGALAIHIEHLKKEVSLLWGHSTESMGVGFMKVSDDKPKSMISILPENVRTGQTISVNGSFFYIGSE